MSEAIVVEKICKQYLLGEFRGETMLREALARFLKNPFSRGESEDTTLWALKDVNFTVQPGEIVGIVGRNGAGKSTLLKVLSRITFPTSGRIATRGRMASLLEVGTGFHEELTGRENVYLNGSIMGMSRKETESKLDEIVSFANVEKFLDTPIKRYSSGMRMRLGFAVAAHLDADILLVDEVLAVGDTQFQRKCLDTMGALRSSGRTVLFVSHNMAAVENLCPRSIWIDAGQIRQDGPTEDVIRAYMSTFATAQHGGAGLEDIQQRLGNGEGRFTGVEFLDRNQEPLNYVRSGDAVTIRVHFKLNVAVHDLRVGLEVNTDMGMKLVGTNNWATGFYVPAAGVGRGYMDFEIDFLNIMPGRYYLSLYLGPHGHIQDALVNNVIMDVEPSDYFGTGRGMESSFGLMFLPSRWKSDCIPVPSTEEYEEEGVSRS